jgi:hypothetical protein
MGLTTLIAAAYVVLIGLTVFAFVKKKWAIGIILSALMVIGTVILGFMWFTSPM